MSSTNTNPYSALKGRFLAIQARRDLPGQEWANAFVYLADRYREPWRHYHTLEHIAYCLSVFDRFKHLAHHPDPLELAIYYHDAVYDIGVPARQNEERSAELARITLVALGLGNGEANIVKQMVLATTHDHVPGASDDKLIVDIDLAGLGAPWPVFLQNNRNVREEYRSVPEDKFREGNGKILGQFLERRPLFYHPYIEAELGDQARDNLHRWLSRP